MRNQKMYALMLAATFALSAVCSVIPAKAGTTYTPVAGTSTTFSKYLVMDQGDTVPNATFSFTVAPGTAIPATSGANPTMAVLAGVGSPTIADVTFAPSDTTSTTSTGKVDLNRTNADRGGSAGDAVHFDSGEKFAEKTATVDFSSVRFPEPGIYRYIISETADAAHAAAGITHDTDTDRVLDVYVTDDNGSLAVSSYVLHTDVGPVQATVNAGSGDVGEASAPVADKTDGFTNECTGLKDLKFEKEVTGNQASRDKYFEYTVTCTGVADADTYVVSLADDNNDATNDGSADATSGDNASTIPANQGQTNPASVTGAQLKAGQKFYLQHGQSIVIRGLAQNAGYTVVENAEDYKSAVKSGDTNSGTIGTVAGDNKMVTAGFTNTRDGIIPTGVVSAIAGGAVLLGIGAGGLALSSRKKEEDDE